MTDALGNTIDQRNLEQPSWRARLGGRWVFSWQAFLITLPFAPVVLISSDVRSGNELGGWIVASLVGITVLAGVNYLMQRTIFRKAAVEPVPIAVVVGSSIFTMSLLIAVVTTVGVQLGLPYENSPMARGIQTLLIGLAWSLVLVLMLEARWRLSVEQGAVIENAVQQRLLAMQEAEVIDTVRATLRDDVSMHLAPAREVVERRLTELRTASIDVEQAAETLRETAQSTVRPLSHRLERQAIAQLPRPRIRDVLRNIIARQPFRPLAISIIYVLATAPREIERHGWTEGFQLIALTIGLIFATMTLANWTMRRWPEHHSVLFIAGIGVIQAPSLVFPLVVSATQRTSIPWIDITVTITIGIILIFVTSGFGSWRSAKEDLLRTFASEVREEQIEAIARSRALAAITREAAAMLHGTVQTKLVACAMAIDHAAASGDLVAVNQALVQARAILEQPLPEIHTSTNGTVVDLVERKVELWRGLVEVTVDVEPGAANLDGRLAADVAAVVEEGVANAIEHGSATRVEIAISRVDDELVIRIIDDGAGPAIGVPGLGSRLLDQVAPSWHLEAHDAGAGLTVTMPIPGRTDSPSAANLWV